MPRVDEVQQRLRSLNSYENLLKLLETLGFTYSGEPRSTIGWPSAIQQEISDFRLVAYHGAFGIFYLVVPEDRMLGWERQITERLLKIEPHSLLVFTNKRHDLWHFVHVRWDEQAERRRQLRRFVVNLQEPQMASRLRTTSERLSNISIITGEQLSALELQRRCDDAFRISEVTKRFLSAFVGVVADLTDSLKMYNPTLLITEADALRQAQLLMDRLVFLYFVQKKGWLNGEQDYMYRRFRICYDLSRDEDTFYRERLLPLFRALSHRNAIHPRIDGIEESIPFLNGGLFDLPLSSGSANPPLDERIRVPNGALYQVFEDFLERYNFTTTEDTPLDVEVAINPEVIGTIFETFVLTSENEPETNAPDRRKATGSYYTPRCVVHFICRAVFRRYLAEQTSIDEAMIKRLIEFLPAEQLNAEQEIELRELVSAQQAGQLRSATLTMRACDPAVGSGAFLVGLLHEMVKLVTLLDLLTGGHAVISRRNYAYELKKKIIEDCLYGVDIQEEAVQICELRLWLSLVIDYEAESDLPLKERMEHIEPLPNLTFRVRVGDSLLDQIFGHEYNIGNSRHDDLIGQINTAKRLYYESESPESKREREREIFRLQLQLLERLLDAERLETGAPLPMLTGLITARQKRELEDVKIRLAEIEDLLKQSRAAQSEVNKPITDITEYTRYFDAVRKKFKVSFVWKLDFAEVFDPDGRTGNKKAPGFDVIVGNPPFVTARNPEKREKYRHQWPTSCYKKYHMLSPFIEVALIKLLRSNGELGYIVSNAFATRDFGKPLVEQVFQHLELRNVVDCSGLMFPGHGTPTCILLGHTISTKPAIATLLCGTRPGMGQLRDEPEETELWAEIEAGWEMPDFSGKRMDMAGWTPATARTHPWSLNAAGKGLQEQLDSVKVNILEAFSQLSISYSTVSGMDPVFVISTDFSRRIRLQKVAIQYAMGEDLRDWSVIPSGMAVFPYSTHGDVLSLNELPHNSKEYFEHMRPCLQNRQGMLFQNGILHGDPWYRYEYYDHSRASNKNRFIWAFIATHISASIAEYRIQTNRSINNFIPTSDNSLHLLALLNSSSALFYLRQICFCKRESDNPETDNYYEFAGGKVEQLPVPRLLINNSTVRARAGKLAEHCSSFGALVPGLHPRKLFEKPGEAYTDWYRGVRGYQPPNEKLHTDWRSTGELKAAWQSALDEMHRLRKQMAALQEEMDWLIYGAYSLIPLEHPAVNLDGSDNPMPIDRMERPYRLADSGQPSPLEWPQSQRVLWQARLNAIAENELIAQVEQPAYKRRWEEPFGNKDFLLAYEWWLREKAEWLLEKQFNGGPMSLESWAAELQKDPRVQAAYKAALEIGVNNGDKNYQRDRAVEDFTRHLKRIIEEETVPDRRDAFKKKHEKFRSIDPDKHLPNGIPRERFRSLTEKPGWYVWAGKDIWGGVTGDKWND